MSNIVELKKVALNLHTERKYDKEIEIFDSKSRTKVFLLHAILILTLILFSVFNNQLYLIPLFIVINGFFSIAYLRVFMHSEMHWGLSENKLVKFYLRWIVFGLYQVPFTAYVFGHRAHHRYDNDHPESNKLSSDKQSTYLYENSGKPINPVLWMLHYLFIYQFFHQIKYVITDGKKKDLIKLILQIMVIIFMDVAIFYINKMFFLYVFIPSILVSWLGSGIVLYMMHNIEHQKAKVHHSVNSYDNFFNKFGDNDGLHIVHSLFPFLHPIHAPEIDKLVYLELDEKQKLKEHYVIAFFKIALNFKK
ncbi:hypothetical protein AV645_10280 [Acinetobacter calcoaceticus]|uniref:Fatty acid desaturase domain-containing protein n=1 Tax=Acinetobacter oleivorans TaxID=1148157 RepID=A0A0B2U9H9_9GAMM|nr:fatty acid desaturase [Acinetobacter calcoaceticus]KHN65859.1 hypothetical protein DH17_05875 [Acinetobacter oleivorans]KUM12029.1 hypothetical protein AV645_10280 [Acinetobacter calcoaceticus]